MEKPLDQQEIGAFEAQLRALHATLSERLGVLEEESFVPGEEGQLGQRYDTSLEEEGREGAAEVLGSEESLLYAVRDALERIREGGYGRCESCERPIERERLEVVPHARLCATCARQAESSGAF